ncbi:MAG: tetratricopeptide repeat-containing glycosyltransferase family protein [Burkholderiales bacterium]|nr:tetratricopeptide repeat-containing glycosyltransferase family protein [Burkholderiales bacterium]
MLKNLLLHLLHAPLRLLRTRRESRVWPDLESAIADFNRRNYAEVVAKCRAALLREPRSAQANHLCGRALMELERHAEAEACLNAAVAADPALAEAYSDLALVMLKAGDYQAAEKHCRQAVKAQPKEPRYRLHLAEILESTGRDNEALMELLVAQEYAPDQVDVLQELLIKLDQLGQYAEALRVAERALVELGETFETWFFLAYARYSTGDSLGAVEASARAISFRANVPGIYVTRGSALLALGKIEEAAASYQRALRLQPDYPDALFHLGMVNLMRGRYRDGWAGFEYRFKIRRANRRSCEPRWNGTSLRERTLHVMREQGLGDDIMYSSCFPQLIKDAKHCYIECEPRLEKLFARSFPEATFIPLVDNATKEAVLQRDDIDVRIFSASVPGYLRNSLRDFPRHQGYLRADTERTRYWREKLAALGDGLKVGISWRGGTVHTNRKRRTLSLDTLQPLLALPGVHWVNLQYGERAAEIAGCSKAAHDITITDWPEAIDGDYDETAALVSALDLVISVCTSVIHLAGALGRPVWVMVPRAAEWRYGLEGETMPWYPTARLLRQSEAGSWEAVIARAREDLARRLNAALE